MTTPPPQSPPPPPQSPASAPLANTPPPAPGNLWLNLLIAASFMIFAFSGYWLYAGYRDSRAAAAKARADAEDRHAMDGGMGEAELQKAANTAVDFLRQRPEFTAEVGELLEPGAPFQYRMQTTDELGQADDLKFRITIRGAKSSAWYDVILRPAADHWDLMSAQLIVPDAKAADGRKIIHLLDPSPQGRLP